MIFQAWNSVGGRPVGWEDAKKKSAAKGTCFAKVRENACFQDHFFGKDCKNFIEFQGFMKLQEPTSTSRFARARNVLKNVSSCFSEFQAWTM